MAIRVRFISGQEVGGVRQKNNVQHKHSSGYQWAKNERQVFTKIFTWQKGQNTGRSRWQNAPKIHKPKIGTSGKNSKTVRTVQNQNAKLTWQKTPEQSKWFKNQDARHTWQKLKAQFQTVVQCKAHVAKIQKFIKKEKISKAVQKLTWHLIRIRA